MEPPFDRQHAFAAAILMQGADQKETMGSNTALRPHAGKTATATAYAGALGYLAWATISNHLGDQIYGQLVLSALSFPVSIIDWFAGDAIFTPMLDRCHGGPCLGWDYVALLWPGTVMASMLALFLALSRTEALGRVMGWVLTVATLLAGLVIVTDQWAPRQLWGWPVVACGAVMIGGLLRSRRRGA